MINDPCSYRIYINTGILNPDYETAVYFLNSGKFNSGIQGSENAISYLNICCGNMCAFNELDYTIETFVKFDSIIQNCKDIRDEKFVCIETLEYGPVFKATSDNVTNVINCLSFTNSLSDNIYCEYYVKFKPASIYIELESGIGKNSQIIPYDSIDCFCSYNIEFLFKLNSIIDNPTSPRSLCDRNSNKLDNINPIFSYNIVQDYQSCFDTSFVIDESYPTGITYDVKCVGKFHCCMNYCEYYDLYSRSWWRCYDNVYLDIFETGRSYGFFCSIEECFNAKPSYSYYDSGKYWMWAGVCSDTSSEHYGKLIFYNGEQLFLTKKLEINKWYHFSYSKINNDTCYFAFNGEFVPPQTYALLPIKPNMTYCGLYGKKIYNFECCPFNQIEPSNISYNPSLLFCGGGIWTTNQTGTGLIIPKPSFKESRPHKIVFSLGADYYTGPRLSLNSFNTYKRPCMSLCDLPNGTPLSNFFNGGGEVLIEDKNKFLYNPGIIHEDSFCAIKLPILRNSDVSFANFRIVSGQELQYYRSKIPTSYFNNGGSGYTDENNEYCNQIKNGRVILSILTGENDVYKSFINSDYYTTNSEIQVSSCVFVTGDLFKNINVCQSGVAKDEDVNIFFSVGELDVIKPKNLYFESGAPYFWLGVCSNANENNGKLLAYNGANKILQSKINLREKKWNHVAVTKKILDKIIYCDYPVSFVVGGPFNELCLLLFTPYSEFSVGDFVCFSSDGLLPCGIEKDKQYYINGIWNWENETYMSFDDGVSSICSDPDYLYMGSHTMHLEKNKNFNLYSLYLNGEIQDYSEILTEQSACLIKLEDTNCISFGANCGPFSGEYNIYKNFNGYLSNFRIVTGESLYNNNLNKIPSQKFICSGYSYCDGKNLCFDIKSGDVFFTAFTGETLTELQSKFTSSGCIDVKENNLFLNLSTEELVRIEELKDVTNLSIQDSVNYNGCYTIGGLNNSFLITSPKNISVSFDRNFLENDFLLKFTGKSPILDLFIYDGIQYYHLKNLYLTDYSVNVSVGEIVNIKNSFTSYGENLLQTKCLPSNFTINTGNDFLSIPNLNSISIEGSSSQSLKNKNNIYSLTYSSKINRQPFYSIGSLTPICVETILPIEISIQEQTKNKIDFCYFKSPQVANDTCYINFYIKISGCNCDTIFPIVNAKLINSQIQFNSQNILDISNSYLGFYGL